MKTTIKPITFAGMLLLAGTSGSHTWAQQDPPGIEGKYQAHDAARSTAEFLSDGTLIFVSGGQQGVWKWSKLDGGRLKLEPGPGMIGTRTAVCDYLLGPQELRLLNCHMAVVLTRMAAMSQ